jgi:hypothetical protein
MGVTNKLDWRKAMIYIKKGMLFILAAAWLFVIPAAVFSQDVVAYIGEVSGDVTIVKANPGEEIKAEIGALLSGGDTLKTGADSYTSIIFQDDGSRVKLGENAVLTLNVSRKQKKLSKKMKLDKGKVWAKVTKKRDTDFQVNTPTSVASVKGTDFIVEEHPWGETWVWVLEGLVALSNGKSTVDVNEGEKGTATEDSLNVEQTGEGDNLLEPGSHTINIHMKRTDNPSIRKELIINVEN